MDLVLETICIRKFWRILHCLALIADRLPVTAWKPVLIVCTEHLEWQVMHCKKKSLVSLFKMVSGDRQVWQVTYSLM